MVKTTNNVNDMGLEGGRQNTVGKREGRYSSVFGYGEVVLMGGKEEGELIKGTSTFMERAVRDSGLKFQERIRRDEVDRASFRDC